MEVHVYLSVGRIEVEGWRAERLQRLFDGIALVRAAILDKDTRAQPGLVHWREVDVAELAIGDALHSDLRNNGLNTMGRLSDFLKSGGKLTDFLGLGVIKDRKIRTAYREAMARLRTEG